MYLRQSIIIGFVERITQVEKENFPRNWFQIVNLIYTDDHKYEDIEVWCNLNIVTAFIF